MAEPLTNIEVITNENNLRLWEVVFTGPVSCFPYCRTTD